MSKKMSLSTPADRIVSGTFQQILALPMMCSIARLRKSMNRSPARASTPRLPRVLKSRLPLKSGKQSSFGDTTCTKPGRPPRWETSRPCEESSWSSCADRDAIKNVSASAIRLTSLSPRWAVKDRCWLLHCSDTRESLRDVRDQIGRVFNADRQPDRRAENIYFLTD